jgi:hypothetical protein
LLIGWPLRSVCPVSLARGASPVYDVNRVPPRKRAVPALSLMGNG